MEDLVRGLMDELRYAQEANQKGFLTNMRRPLIPPFESERLDAILNNITAKEYILLQRCSYICKEEDIRAYVEILTKLLDAGAFKDDKQNQVPVTNIPLYCQSTVVQPATATKTEFVEKVNSGINNSNEEA